MFLGGTGAAAVAEEDEEELDWGIMDKDGIPWSLKVVASEVLEGSWEARLVTMFKSVTGTSPLVVAVGQADIGMLLEGEPERAPIV